MKINAVFIKKPAIKRVGIKADESYRSLLLIFLVILISMVCGALAYCINRNAFSGELWNGFVRLMTDKSRKSFSEIFSGFYSIDLLVLILLSVFGSASIGFFPTIITVAFRTAGIGTIGAFLFVNHYLIGLKYYLLVIVPGKLLLFFGLLLAAQNSIQTSRKVKQITDGKTNEKIDKKLFAIRNGVCAAIFALSALVDAALIYLIPAEF